MFVPDIDLTTDEDSVSCLKSQMKLLSLLRNTCGQMWGEHGRGYRSCYGEVFFKELYSKAQEVKSGF